MLILSGSKKEKNSKFFFFFGVKGEKGGHLFICVREKVLGC